MELGHLTVATWDLALKRTEPDCSLVHSLTWLLLALHGSLEHCGLILDIYHETNIYKKFYFFESILSEQWVKKALVKVQS